MLIPSKLGLTGIKPPEKQNTSGKNPAYEEGVKKITKERLDTVKFLRETEARIRTVQNVLKEVGTESAFGKQQKAQLDQLLSNQATYNKKIKFLDSRLKDPKLVSTYVETKQPIPQELKPSFGQEVLLGEKDWQKALVQGQNKYNKMANDALEAVGFKYVPEGIIKDITKGVLNPLSYTQTVADIFGNPTKFMDDTFYTMANPNASAEERAMSGLNFVLFVASVVPGAAALKRGGVNQLLDEAVEKAVKAGVKVESAVNKVKNALDPATYKAIIEKSKALGTTVVEKGKAAVQKGVAKIDEAAAAVGKGLTPQMAPAGTNVPAGKALKKQPSKMMGGAGGGQFKLPTTLDDAFKSTDEAVRQWLENFTDPDELEAIFNDNKKILKKADEELRSVDAKIESVKRDKDVLKNFDYGAYERKKKSEAYVKWDDWKKANPQFKPGDDEFKKANNRIFAEPKELAREEFERLKANANISVDDLLARKNILENQLDKANKIDKDIIYRLGGDAPYVSRFIKAPTRLLQPPQKRNLQRGFINLGPVVDFIFSKNRDTKSLLDKLKVGDPSAVIRPVYDRLIESGLTPERARAVEREIATSMKTGQITLTSAGLSANEKKIYDSIVKLGKGELVEKNGVLVIFPMPLQKQIEDELKKINPTIASKLFSRLTPFITEKRAVATKLPSLLPTAELRATDVGTFNKTIKDNAKTYLDIAKNIRNVDDNLLMPIRDLLTNTSIDDILKNKSFDTIISDASLPQAVRDLATQLRDKIITIDELGKAGKARKKAPKPGEGYKVFDNSKTLYENLTEGLTKDVALDTIYGKAFSFNKYLDLSPEQLKKIDPIAFLFEIDNSAARKQAFRGSVVTRNVVTDFIKDALDNPANNFTEAQKKEATAILKAFNSTVEQLTGTTPVSDKQFERFFGAFNFPYLAKISGLSQVAGNVGTALSQLPPLAQNVAINGIVDSLSGIMSVMKGGFGDATMKDIWAKSNFLANRLETNTQDALYANMKKEYFKQFGKETQVMLRRAASKYGEDVVQRLSRTFISKMDEAVSKTFWTSSYNRALKTGVSEKEAIAFADFITERTLSGREAGALPEVFATQWGKSIFQYGLEVFNQLPTAADFYRDKTGGVLTKGMKAFDAALKYSIAAYLINNAVEKANNRRPAFDPIGLTEDYLKSQDKTTQSPITEKAKGLPLVGPALTSVAGRAPSKSFIGGDEEFVAKLIDGFTGVSRVSLQDLPSYNVVIKLPQLYDILRGQGAYEKVGNLGTIQKAAVEDLFAQLIPGGNQAKKVVAGLRAISPEGYVDERKIKTELADDSLKYDIDAFDKNKAVVAYRNALQRAEKNVKIPVPPEVMQAMQALLFGAKGTTEYRVKTATLADFDNEIKRLEAEKKIKPDMKDALQTKIDDVIERRRKFLGMKREPGKE